MINKIAVLEFNKKVKIVCYEEHTIFPEITTWEKGETEEVFVLNETEKTIDIQFGDGAVAYQIKKEDFIVKSID